MIICMQIDFNIIIICDYGSIFCHCIVDEFFLLIILMFVGLYLCKLSCNENILLMHADKI